jgi:hypothetical protein
MFFVFGIIIDFAFVKKEIKIYQATYIRISSYSHVLIRELTFLAP